LNAFRVGRIGGSFVDTSVSVSDEAKGYAAMHIVIRSSARAALILSLFFLSDQASRAAGKEPKEPPPAKKDFYGDPLPPGVVARLGSAQLRHPHADWAFSADGKTMISAGTDQRIHRWDVASGKRIKTVTIQRASRKEPLHQFTLSPNGELLVAHEGKQAIIYNTATGKEVRSFTGEEAENRWFTFAPDGKAIAIRTRRANGSETAHVWDVDADKERFAIELGTSVWHIAFSHDGKGLAVSESDNKLRLFDSADGKELAHLEEPAWSLAFAGDGKTLATAAGSDETVLLRDAATLKAKETLRVGTVHTVMGITFAPDADLLAVQDPEGLIIWDLQKKALVNRVKHKGYTVCRALFSPGGKVLAVDWQTGSQMQFWDVASGEPLHKRPSHDTWIGSIAISSDSRTIASSALHDAHLRLWDAVSGKPLGSCAGEDLYVQCCALSPDGKRAVSAGSQGTFQVWDLAGLKEERRFMTDSCKARPFLHLSISPLRFLNDGKQIATVFHVHDSGEKSEALIWEVATGELVSHRLYIADISSGPTANGGWWSRMGLHANFTPDGKAVTERTGEGLTVRDLSTGRVQVLFPRVEGRPAAFSPDGRRFAARATGNANNDSGDGNKSDGVRLVETLTGKEFVYLQTEMVHALDFSPDCRILATADEKAMRFWDVATGKELVRRPWPEPYSDPDISWPANTLHFLPNGKGIVTGMNDGIILVWEMPAEAQPPLEKANDLGAGDLDGYWAELGDDPPKAWPALRALCRSPKQAVAYLKERLKPAAEADAKQVQRLLAALDSDQFETRENAARELATMAERIEPALRKALAGKPSEEVQRRVKELLDLPKPAPSGETLRTLRAIQVLERIGTKEAIETLKKLATGAEAARETLEAKEALERLSRKFTTDR
jgi:WD40 repeat protein